MEIEELLFASLPRGPIDLVGYSLGGRLALRFALRYPSRIRSLTLLSAHYGLFNDVEKQARLMTDRVWTQKILSRPQEDFLSDWYNQAIFSSIRQNQQAMNEMLSMRLNQKPKELAKALLTWSLGNQECYRDRLLVFSRPYQIIYGEKDEKFVKLYAHWPTAQEIAKVGHVLHLESAKELAYIIEAFPQK
jgi:2-succinyl-6-hydroxy-2,4-cyclohexadiene-1-carboxylate synthase